MLNVSVVQNQWVIMAVVSGFSTVIFVVLGYLAIWRPRAERGDEKGEAAGPGESILAWYFTFMPWVLTVTFVAVILFGIAYAVLSIFTPPNI